MDAKEADSTPAELPAYITMRFNQEHVPVGWTECVDTEESPYEIRRIK